MSGEIGKRRGRSGIAVVCAMSLTIAISMVQAQQPSGPAIDFTKAKEIRSRFMKGEEISKVDRAYLERAKAEFAKKQASNKGGVIILPRPSTGMVPITDLTGNATYKGQKGGLYGNGQNTPPKTQLDAALAAVKKIQPLDRDGKPSATGKVVLISVGMSNTMQEFSAFMRIARNDVDRSPRLQIVDGAQGGMEGLAWSSPERVAKMGRPDPWSVLADRLKEAGVSPSQVQVAWIKQARANPSPLGAFPEHSQELTDNLTVIVKRLKKTYPNFQIAYLSSRIYAGYASTPLNPEPYAYEGAFSVRGLIDDQIAGKNGLKDESPVLLWGPYLWADGVKGRAMGDLVWNRDDLGADGTHPSPSGQMKVAKLLLDFFKTDPTAKIWFIGRSSK